MSFKLPTRGFTLVETLVAIALLMVAVAGPLLVARQALVNAEGAKDRLTAQYLAQEGIEYVRMLRDNAFLSKINQVNAGSLGWDEFLNGSIVSDSISFCRTISVCALDPANTIAPFAACPGGACPLYLSNGLYQLGTAGTLTTFVRKLTFTDVSATQEDVDVRVDWTLHGVTRHIQIDDSLTPWQ